MNERWRKAYACGCMIADKVAARASDECPVHGERIIGAGYLTTEDVEDAIAGRFAPPQRPPERILI